MKRVFNDIEDNGPKPNLKFSEGWLCPIYKKEDRTDIGNYWPITVLNTDYRMLTKILTTRLGEIAGEIIHNDQARFMLNRQITDQMDLAQILVNYAETTKKNGVIVSLDQEKAYDKIRHDFFWATLKKLGFPDKFVLLIQNLYRDAETVVVLNGIISNPLKITRGVRQGDPLSCLLFNTAIESLAQMLRDSNLQGYEIPTKNNRLIASLFADDTTAYLSAEDDFHNLNRTLYKWCKASGAQFNLSKTNILPIGTTDYRETVISTRKINPTHQPIPDHISIIPNKRHMRVLGCFIGNNVNHAGIWTPIVDTIRGNLNRWSKSHPTLEGK